MQFQVLPRRRSRQEPAAPRRRHGRAAAGAGQPPSPTRADGVARAPERLGPASPAPGRAKPAATRPAGLDKEDLTRRVVGALARRAPAGDLPVKVRSNDGTVTLSGQVPSAFEAMIVYRAAQQTPGVREVVDRLEFTVPDEDHPNPLLQKSLPEDLEPYLASQIRRHVGDLAHIDKIETHGDSIDIKGTLRGRTESRPAAGDPASIPVLHGFRIEAELSAE